MIDAFETMFNIGFTHHPQIRQDSVIMSTKSALEMTFGTSSGVDLRPHFEFFN